MKGICFEIKFQEAFFKVFLTMKYRISYPIPLPTHIAGIIGSMLGIYRREITDFFKDLYLGGIALNLSTCYENSTLVEISEEGRNRSVEKCMILNEPSFIIFVLGNEDKILRIRNILESKVFEFLPFGGQNDYFLKNIEFLSDVHESSSNIIDGGYVESVLVKNLEENSRIMILPVNYKNSIRNFTFIIKGRAELKENIKTCELTINSSKINAPIYLLEDFGYKISDLYI